MPHLPLSNETKTFKIPAPSLFETAIKWNFLNKMPSCLIPNCRLCWHRSNVWFFALVLYLTFAKLLQIIQVLSGLCWLMMSLIDCYRAKHYNVTLKQGEKYIKSSWHAYIRQVVNFAREKSKDTALSYALANMMLIL